MQRLPKRLIEGTALAVTSTALYETPGGTYTTISALTVTNTSAAVTTVTVFLVIQGASPGAGNAVLWKRALAPGESRVVGEAIGQTLHAGGTIQAEASVAASITLVASGYETIA